MKIDLVANPSGAPALVYSGDDELAGIRKPHSGTIRLSFLSGKAIEIPIAPELAPAIEHAAEMQVVRIAADETRQTGIYRISDASQNM